MEKHLTRLRLITSNAVVESFLENTLNAVEDALHTATVFLSSSWLQDRRLREKMFTELNQVLNLVPLRVLSRTCWKAMTMVETTALDLCLSSFFEQRLDRMKDLVLRMDALFHYLREAQNLWYYLLHIVKFSARGELERDSLRLFNSCTEDLKKMETVLSPKSGSLLSAFQAAIEHDLNAESVYNTLHVIADDVHGAIQSLLDACPRLSLLSYNRLVTLYKTWLLGAHHDVAFVSVCMGELFEGVGCLRTYTLISPQKLVVCTGFVSSNKLEIVQFTDHISMELPLDEFVRTFEDFLRKTAERSCDWLMLHRTNCMRTLLADQQIETIVNNMDALFRIRYEQLKAMIHDDYLSCAFVWTNYCGFAEDIWTLLGHPSGSIIVARPSLLLESSHFAHEWQASFRALERVIRDNIRSMQEWFTQHPAQMVYPHTNSRKSRALMSSLLTQEIAFLQQIVELQQCRCLESATELWAGKYQYRFEFEKSVRYRNAPFEISVGNISVPHGLEYTESGAVCLYSVELEYAIGRVLSSAFAFRGTTFVLSAPSLPSEVDLSSSGEYKVSGRDLALALGRLCIVLSDASSVQHVRFFLSKLVYLDALGVMSFTSIEQSALSLFIQTAQ